MLFKLISPICGGMPKKEVRVSSLILVACQIPKCDIKNSFAQNHQKLAKNLNAGIFVPSFGFQMVLNLKLTGSIMDYISRFCSL